MPSNITDNKHMITPNSMMVLHTGCDDWITLKNTKIVSKWKSLLNSCRPNFWLPCRFKLAFQLWIFEYINKKCLYLNILHTATIHLHFLRKIWTFFNMPNPFRWTTATKKLCEKFTFYYMYMSSLSYKKWRKTIQNIWLSSRWKIWHLFWHLICKYSKGKFDKKIEYWTLFLGIQFCSFVEMQTID